LLPRAAHRDGFDNLRALIDPSAAPAKEADAAHVRGTARADGRCSIRVRLRTTVERSRPFAGCCSVVTEIVFRELLTRETILPKWRELLITLRRLEDRGEIRGGRFVSALLGEQFALPVAVESLRAMRNQQPTGEIITVSAADP